MGDVYPKFKAAAVMAAPIFLDREATVEKACGLINEAAGQGASLIVFPEVYIPAFPYWSLLGTPTWGAPFFKELFKNAVEIPSPSTDTLCKAAKQANAYVVMGLNERDGGTLYNTLLYISPEGDIMGKHRKLQPTHVERTVWGRGDGSDVKVFDTRLGGLGGLICWEHTMDLIRYATLSLGEQIHVAVWPGVSAITHNPRSGFFNEIAESACRHHAVAGQTFVICVQSVINQDVLDKLGMQDRPEMIRTGGGWSAIFNPDGQIIGGPLKEEEGIVYADIDMEQIIMTKWACDSLGHYARPDIAKLVLNLEPQPIIENRPLSDTKQKDSD